MLRLGYHVSVAQSMDLAFDRANEMTCTAMQVFVSNPRGWETKTPPEEQKKRFVEKSKAFDIHPVVAHMPYLPNLASGNKDTRSKSVKSLEETASICANLGIKYLVAHLGSHLGKGSAEGIRNVIDAVNGARKPAGVGILLENTAGHANSVGSSLEELAEILDGMEGNVGLCLDTCHLFAAGYDITREDTMDAIGREVGMDNVLLFHLNDAKFELGSRKDRHENIGKGYIGEEGFRRFLGYKGVPDKPLILETPEGSLPELSLVRKLAASL